MDADREFLAWQLGQTPASTVLVNGGACVKWLHREGLVSWPPAETSTFLNANGSTGRLQVWRADRDGKRYVGWNRPLAGPVPAAGRQLLQEWVRDAAAR